MSKIQNYKTLKEVATRLRSDLKDLDVVLLYAYNGTGKTRLSMAFKDWNKTHKKKGNSDTLYFNAFTEDLFRWDNDLQNDTERVLKLNVESKFFTGFKALGLETRIFGYFERYANVNFKIDYENWHITFERGEVSHLKVSRGEENIFIWCIYMSLCELTLEEAEAYNWVQYFYMDDPISSLDDNNAIIIASDLAKLLRQAKGKIKVVISSHHSLFYNVMCNELKKQKHKKYFLHKKSSEGYALQSTTETPYFHHIAMLKELKNAVESNKIKTYHFNLLRSVLEKTAVFFGLNDFEDCIKGIDDAVLYERALNLLSHGKYSMFDPVEMNPDNKELFKQILEAFLKKYPFRLPES